jgi:hypothetical protein
MTREYVLKIQMVSVLQELKVFGQVMVCVKSSQQAKMMAAM